MNFNFCFPFVSLSWPHEHSLLPSLSQAVIICVQLGLLRPMRETLQKYGRSNLR